MTDILEPSRRVKNLRSRLYDIKDRRLIMDILREIQRECITIEIQLDKVTAENRRLVHEANIGLPDEEVAF